MFHDKPARTREQELLMEISTHLKGIKKGMDKTTEELEENHQKVLLTKEWSVVAMILDWTLFYFMVIVTIVSTLAVLINRPDMRGYTYQTMLEERQLA